MVEILSGASCFSYAMNGPSVSFKIMEALSTKRFLKNISFKEE